MSLFLVTTHTETGSCFVQGTILLIRLPHYRVDGYMKKQKQRCHPGITIWCHNSLLVLSIRLHVLWFSVSHLITSRQRNSDVQATQYYDKHVPLPVYKKNAAVLEIQGISHHVYMTHLHITKELCSWRHDHNKTKLHNCHFLLEYHGKLGYT